VKILDALLLEARDQNPNAPYVRSEYVDRAIAALSEFIGSR